MLVFVACDLPVSSHASLFPPLFIRICPVLGTLLLPCSVDLCPHLLLRTLRVVFINVPKSTLHTNNGPNAVFNLGPLLVALTVELTLFWSSFKVQSWSCRRRCDHDDTVFVDHFKFKPETRNSCSQTPSPADSESTGNLKLQLEL